MSDASAPATTARSTPVRHPKYALGVGIVLLAGLFLSLAGVTVRHIDAATGWQILFYRSAMFFVVVFLFLLTQYKGRVFAAFRATGRQGVVISLALGLGSACYVYALLLTTVANALLIISAAPFLTALLGRLVLRESVTALTWVAMLVAIAGVSIMVFDDFVAGRLLGSVMAIGTATTFSIMLVAMRSAPDRDMIPATCLAGIVGAGLALLMADSLVVGRQDLLLCLFLGCVQYAGGFVLITVGARFVPGAEVALLSLSEVVLAPIWVWLAINESPGTLTMIGGGVVLLAVIAQSTAVMNRNDSSSGPPAAR